MNTVVDKKNDNKINPVFFTLGTDVMQTIIIMILLLCYQHVVIYGNAPTLKYVFLSPLSLQHCLHVKDDIILVVEVVVLL